MSNAARLQVPTTGDDGKVPVFDETGDEWDLAWPMIVVTGAIESTPRPAGAAAVYWIMAAAGTTPSNSEDADLVYNPPA